MTGEIQELKSHYLAYHKQELHFESSKTSKALTNLLNSYQGPTYVYDLSLITDRVQQMQKALKEVKLFFAVKANPHLEILKHFKTLNVGADVVSLGEIQRALEAGFLPSQIVYSGVGKTKREIEKAIELDIYQINVESIPELERIISIAKTKNKKVSVAFRLNPNISIETHPYIATGLRDNKFGIELDSFNDVLELCKAHKNNLNVKGVSLHLGSQMLDFSPLRDSLKKLKSYFIILNKEFPECRCFDVGGGLGIFYQKQDLIKENQLLQDYAQVVLTELSELKKTIGTSFEIQSEPGRWLVAHAGVLLSQVQYIKTTPYKNFLVLDTGMNHLMRPSLYEAYHEIFPVKQDLLQVAATTFDVVGPICESADFLAKERKFSAIKQDDFVVIADCGAYGASMSNDYNLQPKAIEICI